MTGKESWWGRQDRWTRWTVFVIMVGSLLRLSLAVVHHVAGDAAWHLAIVRFIAQTGHIPLFEGLGRTELQPFWSPPLFHVVGASVYRLFGVLGTEVSEVAVRFLSPVFGSLLLVVVWDLSRRLMGRKAAFWSVLFVAAVPLFIDYGVFSFIDGFLAFWVVLSIDLMLRRRGGLAIVAACCAALTKYNGIVFLPLLAYLAYTRREKMLAALSIIIPLGSLSLWFLRNQLLLGNPVYPFLGNVFGGLESSSLTAWVVGNLFSPNLIASFFLEFLGIPNGSTALLFFFGPLAAVALIVFVVAGMIWLLPILRKGAWTHVDLVLIWLGLYVVSSIPYILNWNNTIARIILPGIVPLALVWGKGMTFVRGRWVVRFVMMMTVVFILFEAAKIGHARLAWEPYREDFSWMRQNLPPDAIILAGGQSVAYHTRREVLSVGEKNLVPGVYVLDSPGFTLDFSSILTPEQRSMIAGVRTEAVYQNPRSGTRLLVVRQALNVTDLSG